MRDFWFIFYARKRGPELLEQGELVTAKRRAARASAREVAQVDKELPAEAASCEGRRLGEEDRKQHHRDRYANENSKRRVKKRRGVIDHDVVDVRREGEVDGRQEAERADA